MQDDIIPKSGTFTGADHEGGEEGGLAEEAGGIHQHAQGFRR